MTYFIRAGRSGFVIHYSVRITCPVLIGFQLCLIAHHFTVMAGVPVADHMMQLSASPGVWNSRPLLTSEEENLHFKQSLHVS